MTKNNKLPREYCHEHDKQELGIKALATESYRRRLFHRITYAILRSKFRNAT